MPAPGGGNLAPKKVDAFFQGWIDNYKSGKDTKGHIILEHELNSMTVNMSMFWMPRIQKVFNVIPALACNGITQPYWEPQFKYPLDNGGKPPVTTTTTTKTGTATTTTTAPTTTSGATCYPGSAGLGKGDGFSGYCCKDQSDCQDDCISGKCNGPVNTKTSAIPVTTTTKATKTTTAKTTKTTTTKTATPTTPGKCTGSSAGKGLGDGGNGACCKTSDDCQETCRSGVCGL